MSKDDTDAILGLILGIIGGLLLLELLRLIFFKECPICGTQIKNDQFVCYKCGSQVR